MTVIPSNYCLGVKRVMPKETKPLELETYRIIAEAVHQATGGKIPNTHPAYLWIRENLAPLIKG